MKIRHYIVLLLLTLTLPSWSQISVSGRPMPFRAPAEAVGSASPFLKLGASQNFYITLDVDTVRHDADSQYKLLYVGNTCKTDITPENSGVLFQEGGNTVWRVGVTSKGAASIGLVFTEFNIPSDAKLFLYNPDQSIILGAFTAVNNNSSRTLPLQPLASDTVIIEYIEPSKTADATITASLRVGEACHNFYDICTLRRANPGGGNNCTPHINQVEPDNPVKEASCAIYIVGDNQAWWGSGTLINNPGKKPYVISAGHNFNGTEYSEKSIFYFQFHTPRQDTLVVGSMELTIAGAKTLAYRQDLDMALLELNQTPPKDYRPYLAGWDISESQRSPLSCMQHPNGDYTKISYASVAPEKSYISFDRDIFLYKSFWKVSRWSKGTTQAGSSGSALLNAENRIIGTLTGGSSTCASPINDYFSQLSEQFSYYSEPESCLKSWLDPDNEGLTQMNGEYLYSEADGCSRESNMVSGDVISYHYLSGASGYQAGSNSLGHTEYGERFSFDEDMTINGVYLLTYKGTYSSANPVYLNIYSIESGSYTLLSQSVVQPTDYYYTYKGELKSSTFKNWKNREIYVRLAEPINVGRECMIGVQKEAFTSSDSIAIYQTVNRVGDSFNSAYFKSGESWKPFTSYPSDAMPASLWIEPVVSYTKSSTIDETILEGAQPTFSLYPNPTERDITIHSTDMSLSSVKYTLQDISGRVVGRGSAELYNGSATIKIADPKGVYLLTIAYGGRSEVHKVIKR